MGRVRARKRSPAQLATWRVIDAEVDRTLAGHEPRFPDGSKFFPSDIATQAGIAEAHGRGCTVVIVDADESLRVLPAPE